MAKRRGRVERPFGERLVGFAPDYGEADLHRGRDLPVRIAGSDEVQKGLPALAALRPRLLGHGPARRAESGNRFGRSSMAVRRRNLGSME